MELQLPKRSTHPDTIYANVHVSSIATELDFQGVLVMGAFDCSNSKIKSLEGAPIYTTGEFNCSNTLITSLKGAPSRVAGNFFCYNTKITSFEGAPSYIGNGLFCDNTPITSLHNIHKYIKHIGGRLVLPHRVKANVIGVMFIEGLYRIEILSASKKQRQMTTIINKHLQGDRNIHNCQEELLEAGLSEYARL